MIFRLTFPIKAAVRMTQRGKFSSPQAREYLANRDLIRLTLINQMTVNGFEMLPARTPLKLTVDMTVTKNLHTKDFDNLIKSLGDAMKGVVYPDDRWIDRCFFDRRADTLDHSGREKFRSPARFRSMSVSTGTVNLLGRKHDHENFTQ